MTDQASGAAPVTSSERVGELDVLRGFALLGVLIANFVWWAYSPNSATFAQLDAIEADAANLWVGHFVEVFVSDKANTLFAVLFGIGFWVQMERLQARGADFERLYLRRLTLLLLFGLVNLLLIWPWDILNLYALSGFALFMLRRLSGRSMLVLGLVLALVGMPVVRLASEALGLWDPAMDAAFGDVAVEARHQAYVNGNYFDWIGATARLTYFDWIANGYLLAWLAYALGRFLIGATIARRGWITRAAELRPRIRTVFLLATPVGLALEAGALLVGNPDIINAPDFVSDILHAVGPLVLALGYASGLLLLYHSRARPIVLVFAPVGRMALTNYLVQGVFIGLILYGFHGGLALAGQIEPKVVLPLCLAFFALQTLFSHWWLGRYRFGPMEWLWRALTYGERPALRSKAG